MVAKIQKRGQGNASKFRIFAPCFLGFMKIPKNKEEKEFTK